MAVITLHGLSAVEVGTNLVGGISDASVNTGTETRGDAASGEVYNRNQSLVAQKPSAAFTTKAIAQGLDAVSLLGTDVGGLTGGLNLYGQKHADGGARTSGATHRKYGIADGLVFPTTLSVDHQGDATLPFSVMVKYDGSNDPIVPTDDVNLPGGLVDNERFTIGKVTIGGITLVQVRNIEIEFGVSAVPEGSDSNIWDTFVSVRGIKPTITIRGIDIAWFKSSGAIPLLGKAATHANTSIYLRKRLSGGTFVPDATAQHIKFTADGLAVIEGPFSASGNDAGEVSLRLVTRYDGTNAPLTVNTAIAIP